MGFLVVFCILLLLYLVTELYDRGRRAQRSLPTRGLNSLILSYINGVMNCFDGRDSVRRACLKHEGHLFTYPQLGKWFVLARSSSHIHDLCNAPEDILSMEEAAEELLQLRHTVGPLFCQETYHITAIRTSLNSNVSQRLRELIDEVICCYKECVGSRIDPEDEWTAIPVFDAFSTMICRASNRVFVGLPLCRNPDYIDIVRHFSSQIFFAGPIIKFLVPKFLRPAVGSVYRSYYGHHRRMLELTRHLIEERKQRRQEHSSDVVNAIDWLIDVAPELDNQSAESLAMRLLNINFVALHTTTKVFLHALYHLAAQPEYISALREEAELYLGRECPLTWSKEQLGRCVKLDSFFKETLRANPLSSITLSRLSLVDFTFADGTRVGAGHYLAVASDSIHQDSKYYPQPQEFQPFRFSAMRGKPAEQEEYTSQDWVHRMTGTSDTFLAFGSGRHLCPGRFFASLELKIFMAYLVLNYDVKMAREGMRPPNEWLGPMSEPSTKARVLFRRR
ncbi:cytochrome p450 [Moniliophthora roreri MCA 2997]|uniref:Cytochrome p450 n=1 Tax=Moniliophthora roreri (strain MCA 2997) TaxID=1381753 RepID=V2X460_MONRO|nr:cytochrome p450 [Moniliophthora roreri MCA 2997]